MKEDISSYHKYVDNVLLHNPDPASQHYQRNEDRFGTNFAAEDREQRFRERQRKQAAYDKRRMASYDREMTRWEAMEKMTTEEEKDKQVRRDKYGIGKKTGHSAGYNPINGQYDST